MLFPGRELDDTVPHLKELRESISRRAFTLRGKDRPKRKPKQIKPGKTPSRQVFITVSIGGAGEIIPGPPLKF
ncbi:MAG: hypothetical protein ACOY40_11810 [Bacillota bacterium]